MDSYHDYQYDDYENTYQNSYNVNNRFNEPSYKRSNYSSKVIITSKYVQNPKESYTKKLNNQTRKEIIRGEYKTSSYKNSNSTNKKEYNYSQSTSKNNKPRNSNHYYSVDENKYSSTSSNSNLNSTLRRYEPPEPNYTVDGVLRGYTQNCTFYVSGSSELKPKPTIKNKYNTNYNYQRINSRTNRSKYDSKTLDKQSSTPNDFRRRDIPLSSKNDNIYSNYSYNNSSHSNRKKYTSLTTYNENIYDNKSYQNYQVPFIQKGNYRNLSKEKTPVDYSKKIYFETEPNSNNRNYNQRNTYTQSNRQPLIPTNNIKSREPKATITNINNNNIDYNKYQRKIYKTSTNTNLEEKNKINYYKNIEDKNSYQNKKKTNTPTLTKIEIKYPNTAKLNINVSRQNNTIERNKEVDKKQIPTRSNKSEIPHQKGYKYKSETEINENILNKTERNYEPKYTLHKKNSGENITGNKNRYNFPVKPKLREYGTKTEIHSFNNKNKKEEEVYELPIKKNDCKKNYFKKIDNKPEKKSFENRYVSSITPSSRGNRKYNIRTEISMNRSRDDEYEVTDINLFRKQNKIDNYSTSTGRYIPKIMNPINQIRSLLNNKKEYNNFERSLRNIRDNEDKNDSLLRGENIRNNHKIFVSSNLSKPKRIYKTSTQREAFRSHEYRLGDDEEYEPYDKKYKNYNKIKEDINKYNINKNNYFNTMKNLEEEIEIEDEQDQIEYVPPKQLFKINQKSKENSNNYGYLSQKNNYNNNKENKEKNKIGINNQPSKNNNTNYTYHESSQIKNPKKKNFITIHKFKSEEENKNANKNTISNKNINSNANNNIRQTKEQKINIIQNKNKIENQYQQYIPRNQKVQKNENNKQYEFQQSHTEVEFINNHNEDNNGNEYIEYHQDKDNNNLRQSKYGSYFGDSNNNYYEIKGSSSGKNQEENEEEEENEESAPMELVRNVNFGIQSENLCVPGDEDKEEKEADEQQIEEDEQFDNEEENEDKDKEEHEEENKYDNHHDKNQMEKIIEENEAENKNDNTQENDEEEDGEPVGNENENENGEEYDENEAEEEIEENIIEENNENEENNDNEENNENEDNNENENEN